MLLKVFLGALFAALFIANDSSVFKMTNLDCQSLNKTWVAINLCRLRAIRRGVIVFNMNLTIFHPAHEIDLNMVMLKKANGYKPFVINSTIDACEYVEKRNHPVANVIYKLFKDFSNINHSCPYVGDQILDGFHLKKDLFTLPLPDGDYLLLLSWYLYKRKTFVTNVYFTYEWNS